MFLSAHFPGKLRQFLRDMNRLRTYLLAGMTVGILELVIKVIKLNLAEFHVFSITIQEFRHAVNITRGRESQVLNSAVFLLLSSSSVISTPKTSDSTTGAIQDIREDDTQTIMMMKRRIGRKGANAIAKRHPHPILLAPFSSSFSRFLFPPIRLRRNRMIFRFKGIPPSKAKEKSQSVDLLLIPDLFLFSSEPPVLKRRLVDYDEDIFFRNRQDSV